MDSVLASRPAAAQVLFTAFPKIYILRKFILSLLQRIIDSTLLREWTVQSLIVDRTHLELVLGKLVLQKGEVVK